MSIHQIADPLLHQQKVLHVDYFTSKIVQTSRQDFEDLATTSKLSKQQKRMWQYLENQDLHHHKYYRFKKVVNEKYFKQDLPEKYKSTIVSRTLENSEMMSSPRFNKMTSSVLGSSVPIDSSVGDFITNYDSWKSKPSPSLQKSRLSPSTKQSSNQPLKNSKGLSRYWPLEQNFSIIFEQDDKQKSRSPIQTSIYKRSMGQGVKRSFQTMKARPMSQQLTKRTQKVKKIIQHSLNPETNPKNIRHRLNTLTEQHTLNAKILKNQRNSIIDTISKEKLIKFLKESKSIDPKRKGIFSLEDVTDFEKFNLSIPKYMRLKSLRKIDKHAYENFVKEKHGNLEKFQNFILEEFPIQSDNKRKLERIFEQITWQFKRVERRKDAQKR